MYLADFVWFLGIFMLCANHLTLVILLIAYTALLLHIKEEERYLSYLFGDAFEGWQQKTKMLIPYIYWQLKRWPRRSNSIDQLAKDPYIRRADTAFINACRALSI